MKEDGWGDDPKREREREREREWREIGFSSPLLPSPPLPPDATIHNKQKINRMCTIHTHKRTYQHWRTCLVIPQRHSRTWPP
jgi:hypothetical protein